MTDVGDGSIVLAKFSMEDGHLTINASLSIHDGFSWQVEFRGRSILPQHFEFGTSLDTVSAISRLVSVLNNGHTCPGNPDDKFLPLVETRKGRFMDSSGMCV